MLLSIRSGHLCECFFYADTPHSFHKGAYEERSFEVRPTLFRCVHDAFDTSAQSAQHLSSSDILFWSFGESRDRAGCADTLRRQPGVGLTRDLPAFASLFAKRKKKRIVETRLHLHPARNAKLTYCLVCLPCLAFAFALAVLLIAFSTHLTVSRWEPVTSSSSSTSPLASKTSSPSSSPPLTNKASTIVPSKNDPVLASRLMSLANYIRHIVSLTSGNTPLHTQPSLVTPPKTVPTLSYHRNHPPRSNVHDVSLPSPLSAGPGPIKTESSLRRHRFSAGYQGHHTRRQSNSHHAHVLESNVPYHLPSPTSPSFLVRHDPSRPSSTKVKTSPLLKIPYPNLTLTLALIYVDRLKAVSGFDLSKLLTASALISA